MPADMLSIGPVSLARKVARNMSTVVSFAAAFLMVLFEEPEKAMKILREDVPAGTNNLADKE